MTPTLNVTPSAIMFTRNDAKTITHPHPPSGATWENEAVEEEEDDDEEEELSEESLVPEVILEARDTDETFER